MLALIVKYKRLLTLKKIRSQYLFLVKLTMCVFSVFEEEMKRLIQMQMHGFSLLLCYLRYYYALSAF